MPDSFPSNAFTYDFVRLKPADQIPLHTQETWELVAIVSGSGTRTIGSTEESFGAGDVALIPPRMPHRWMFDPADTDPDGTIADIAVSIPDRTFRRLGRLPDLADVLSPLLRDNRALALSGEAAAEIFDCLCRLRGMDETRRFARTLDIIILLAQTALPIRRDAPQSMDEETAESLRIFCKCNLHRPIPLPEAARHIGLSRTVFCAAVRRLFGMTYVDFLNGLRIDEARRRLKTTPDSIAEIARTCGFESATYFNRVFRRATGTTPSRYRESR